MPPQPRGRIEHDRLAAIGRVDDLVVVGHDAEQLDGENLADVFDREHVAGAHHLRAQAIDDQAHRQPAIVELADHAIGVANRADFRRRDDDRFLRAGDRIAETAFDAGRAIDQHVVGIARRPAATIASNCDFGDRVFLARLRGRKNRERLEALVFDQRLAQLAASFGDFDQIEDDALLEPEHQIEIAQADVGVDQHHAHAAFRERGAEIRRGRGLADAALARRDDDATSCHAIRLPPLLLENGAIAMRPSRTNATSGSDESRARSSSAAMQVAMRNCVACKCSA